jgi:hypothetical protein
MFKQRARIQMSDLKALADLLGEVADRMPRRMDVARGLDRESMVMIGVALPKLTATCNALFEALSQTPRPLRTGPRARSTRAR